MAVLANFVTWILFNLRLISVRRSSRGLKEWRIRNADRSRINVYMRGLFSRATSFDVVSGRLSWIDTDPEMETYIRTLASQGIQFRFYLPQDNPVARRLRDGSDNVQVFVSALPAFLGEFPRFTLTNRSSPGSGVLAVGFQEDNDWRSNEFTFSGHPQMKAMARGYVECLERSGKEVS